MAARATLLQQMFRAKCLSVSDPLELSYLHGWLIGLTCAIERKRGSPFESQDALIAELRKSGPPLHEFQSNPYDPSHCLICAEARHA